MSETNPEAAPTHPPISTGRPPELIALPNGVHLRRRSLADSERLNAATVGNLDHLRPWMEWAATAPTLAQTRELAVAGVTAWEDGTDFMYLAGLDEDPGSVVGAFGLHGRIGPGALEIGYWVSASHTGRRIATESAAALTEAALALPGITRVEIRCDEANHLSAAIPRRLGYRLDRTDDFTPTAPAETGRKLIWVKES
ncbi:GNAT family N-acetyltransferase [Kitasatospora sp. NPDC096147]|uniref:GNAT family N-acetyltransferase n=1 Tax=Kitasatospora sp. NPDC096147 TaxID=3364093 RepID=UPI0038166231